MSETAVSVAPSHRVAWLPLALTPRPGPSKARQLSEHFRPPEAVFRASLTELESTEISGQRALNHWLQKSAELARNEIARLSRRPHPNKGQAGAATWKDVYEDLPADVRLALPPAAPPESPGAWSASLSADDGITPLQRRLLGLLQADEATHINELIEKPETEVSSSEIVARAVQARTERQGQRDAGGGISLGAPESCSS